MDEILQLVRTTDDRDQMIDDIDEFEKAQFLGGNRKDGLYKKINSENLKILRQYADDPEALKKLRNDLLDLEIVRVTISYEPSVSTVDMVSSWARENLKRDVLVSFDIDKNIEGGAVISFRGKYANLTIKDQLEIYFRDNRDLLIEKIQSAKP